MSQVELVFVHALHDYLADAVILQGVHEDEDIVQVDNNHSLQDEVMEDLIHHCLEGCRAVCQTEVHHKGFKQAAVCAEGCLPFVTLLDVDIVESPADVQLCKVSYSLEAVDQVIYKGEWVPVFAGYHVEHTVVLYEAEFTILLLNKEDQCAYQKPRWVDATGGEGFLKKCIKFSLFFQCYGVHLMEVRLWVTFELDCVVPFVCRLSRLPKDSLLKIFLKSCRDSGMKSQKDAYPEFLVNASASRCETVLNTCMKWWISSGWIVATKMQSPSSILMSSLSSSLS
jgi:hypothetical protein